MSTQEDLSKYYGMVEECISRLGVDPAICRHETTAGKWSLVKGSAKVWIDVWHIENEGRAYFQVMSPVMQIPVDNRGALFQELLQINDKLFGVAFTIFNDWVWLKVIREVKGMDGDEAFAMLTRIGNYADQYDDLLINKYSPTAGGAPGQT